MAEQSKFPYNPEEAAYKIGRVVTQLIADQYGLPDQIGTGYPFEDTRFKYQIKSESNGSEWREAIKKSALYEWYIEVHRKRKETDNLR